MKPGFTVNTRDSSTRARTGVLSTPHGPIHTPAFVPVGTRAAVKGVLPADVEKLGAQVVLANTYHLYLSPGEKIVESAGGVGPYMNWRGPTITDSGGFQVFSLGADFKRSVSHVKKEDLEEDAQGVSVFDEDVLTQHGQLAIIDDEGVSFTSHIDGSLHRFTPERSVELQHALGADIFFAFDECTSSTEAHEYQKEAMYRTHRWAERSLRAHKQNLTASSTQLIYGIGQGGQYEDLRRESTKTIASMSFDGFGLGGAFSRKDGKSMLPLALSMLTELPEGMPVHGLGVGEPGDILESIAAGVDTFDCVLPTRLGRHGTVYTMRGPIQIKNEKYLTDYGPLDEAYTAPGTEGFTRAYLAHLIRSGEFLGQTIASMHNLGFTISLVDGARRAIEEGRFTEYRDSFLRLYYQSQ